MNTLDTTIFKSHEIWFSLCTFCTFDLFNIKMIVEDLVQGWQIRFFKVPKLK